MPDAQYVILKGKKKNFIPLDTSTLLYTITAANNGAMCQTYVLIYLIFETIL